MIFHIYNFHVSCLIGEGNGNPLQYSYLGNPKDSGAWQTMVHTFAKSQTGLKLPSMHIIP